VDCQIDPLKLKNTHRIPLNSFSRLFQDQQLIRENRDEGIKHFPIDGYHFTRTIVNRIPHPDEQYRIRTNRSESTHRYKKIIKLLPDLLVCSPRVRTLDFITLPSGEAVGRDYHFFGLPVTPRSPIANHQSPSPPCSTAANPSAANSVVLDFLKLSPPQLPLTRCSKSTGSDFVFLPISTSLHSTESTLIFSNFC
jgi:hypothetical protein